jgi:hypothetical protein
MLVAGTLHRDAAKTATGVGRWFGQLRQLARSREARPCRPAVYDQATFRAFLSVEQERARRSQTVSVLLLIDLGGTSSEAGARIDDAVADRVFDTLSSLFRETDFIGWYEDGRVVGAVLPQALADTPEPERAEREWMAAVLRRVNDSVLRESAALRTRLRVRASRLPVAEDR